MACSGWLYDDALPPLSPLLFPSFGLRAKCVLMCVGFLHLPLISRTSSRKSGSDLLLLSHRTRSVCSLMEGCFLRCSLVFGAAFALKILVRFASFRNIWLTEARLDSLAISLNPCAFGIHWILSISCSDSRVFSGGSEATTAFLSCLLSFLSLFCVLVRSHFVPGPVPFWVDRGTLGPSGLPPYRVRVEVGKGLLPCPW